MKKIFTFIIALTMALAATAQTTKKEMQVYFSNGEGKARVEAVFDVNSIDSIRYRKVVLEDPNPNYVQKPFSVSETKQVFFSQGNLQYQASEKMYRFARKQYDIIGDDNNNISDTYDGWIDLFGWGTGNNPTLSVIDDYDEDSIFQYHYTEFTNWGVNVINCGDIYRSSNTVSNLYGLGLWYTLSADEWNYLFRERENATQLIGLGSVNGVNGLIILPDEWTTPDSVTFVPSIEKGLQWITGNFFSNYYYYNHNQDNFTHNVLTAEEWIIMEKAGAVFLPAAGIRVGSEVGGYKLYNELIFVGYGPVGDVGSYWSSSENGEAIAYSLLFNMTNVFTRYDMHIDYGRTNMKFCGQSVRLVCNTTLF